MLNNNHHVVVLGASPKPARYANQAIRLLLEHEYLVTPIHPKFSEIEGLKVVNRVQDIKTPIDTLTLYVGPDRIVDQLDTLITLQPKRVIFNPGTESALFKSKLDEANIEWFDACTLVLLKTNQF